METNAREYRTLKIAISGASGLIGTALAQALTQKGHSVIKLVRKRSTSWPDEVCWDPEIKHLETTGLENIDVVINLSGKNLDEGRWNASLKTTLKESRVKTATLLSHSLSRLKKPPRLFFSASATGFYGDRSDEIMTESAKAGGGFLSQMCREWELATWEAEAIGATVNHLRFGVVLSPDGGALRKMTSAFRFGLGATFGTGQQFMSWVTITDLVRAVLFLIENPQPAGPINITSPNPVSNKDFTKALASALRRPAPFKISESMVRLFFGEKGEALLLESTRAVPEKLTRAGFEFSNPDIGPALTELLRR